MFGLASEPGRTSLPLSLAQLPRFPRWTGTTTRYCDGRKVRLWRGRCDLIAWNVWGTILIAWCLDLLRFFVRNPDLGFLGSAGIITSGWHGSTDLFYNHLPIWVESLWKSVDNASSEAAAYH